MLNFELLFLCFVQTPYNLRHLQLLMEEEYDGTSNASMDQDVSEGHRVEIDLQVATILAKMGSRMSRPKTVTAKHVIRLEKSPLSLLAFEGEISKAIVESIVLFHFTLCSH